MGNGKLYTAPAAKRLRHAVLLDSFVTQVELDDKLQHYVRTAICVGIDQSS